MRLIVKAVGEERRVAGQRLAAAVIAVGQRTCRPSARSSSFLFLVLYCLPSAYSLLSTDMESYSLLRLLVWHHQLRLLNT